MAGGIAEWVLASGDGGPAVANRERHVASRGGAWCDWRGDCNLGARRTYFAVERTARVGFRLVREVREVENPSRLARRGS